MAKSKRQQAINRKQDFLNQILAMKRGGPHKAYLELYEKFIADLSKIPPYELTLQSVSGSLTHYKIPAWENFAVVSKPIDDFHKRISQLKLERFE